MSSPSPEHAAGRPIRKIARLALLVVGRMLSGRVVVRGTSMLPGLLDGQILAVDWLAYALSEPARGDVVVLRETGEGGERRLKRVIGLPGERVRTAEGRVWIDGLELKEPYMGDRPRISGIEEGEWSVGDGEAFVLGDNRLSSTDSRTYGPVAMGLIEGRAWLRYRPLGFLGGAGWRGEPTPGRS